MSTEPIYATSLETAKEGETVLWMRGGWSTDKKVKTITRVTASVIFLGSIGYNRKTGYERGSSRPDRISVTSPEIAKEILEVKEQEELSVKFKHSTHWNNFTLDQLRQVHALVQSFND